MTEPAETTTTDLIDLFIRHYGHSFVYVGMLLFARGRRSLEKLNAALPNTECLADEKLREFIRIHEHVSKLGHAELIRLLHRLEINLKGVN